MNKYNMCLLIVTYNRSNAIDDYLSQKAEMFLAKGIDIVIYDSSPNEETMKVVSSFQCKYGDGIRYEKYQDPAGDYYGTHKSREALVSCAKDYDYVWLCGDTTILFIEDYQEDIENALREESDVIHIYQNDSGIKTQRIDNKLFFFETFFWSMTHWCSFILSSRIILSMDKTMKQYLERGYVNLIVFAIYDELVKEEYGIYYINEKPFRLSKWRQEATAYRKKDILRGYAEMISVGVSELPKYYDPVKKNVMRSFSAKTGLFSLSGVIELRAYGNISLYLVSKYAKHIRKVTPVPVIWFFLWGLLPRRLAIHFAKNYQYNLALENINNKKNKIIVYGAGKHGKEMLSKLEVLYDDITIMAVADKNWEKVNINFDYDVIDPTKIGEFDFDYVAVAIINKKIYKEIRKNLVQLGVAKKKILKI